ncbi:MAG: ACT domain-containing protein [Gemmatimonadaceae bacterium]
MMPQSNTLKLLMLNRAGTLHRTLTLLRRLRYNIVSLRVGPSETPDCSEMVVVTDTSISPITVRRLERLIDVLDVQFGADTPLNAIVAGGTARTSSTTPDGSSHFRAQADGVHCDEAA